MKTGQIEKKMEVISFRKERPKDCYSCRNAIPILTEIGTMCCTIEQRMLKAEDGIRKGKPDWCPLCKGCRNKEKEHEN